MDVEGQEMSVGMKIAPQYHTTPRTGWLEARTCQILRNCLYMDDPYEKTHTDVHHSGYGLSLS